jgi:hypothetical protein
MTQQEINEAAEEYEYTDGIYGFKAGVKWQQERSYSDEEVKPLLDAIEYFINRVENGTIRSKTTYNMYKEILLQFKNK